MNVKEIIELRDKLREELATVEKFLEIAKLHGGLNGTVKSIKASGAAEKEIPNPNQTTLPMDGNNSSEYGGIAEIVREGIHICSDTYTINDVMTALDKLGKPLRKLQVATTLTRFAHKTKEITVLHAGVGSKPTIYKK